MKDLGALDGVMIGAVVALVFILGTTFREMSIHYDCNTQNEFRLGDRVYDCTLREAE